MNDTVPSSLRPEHPIARSLEGLAAQFALETRGDVDGVEISGVGLSSSDTEPGDLFVGMPGQRVHGARFAAAAAQAGATAILTDEAGAQFAADSGLPMILTHDVRSALGPVAAWVYRTQENQASLFAVTGTNGKTSVVYLLDAILTQLGIVSGLSSTSERRIGRFRVTSCLTTPEASEVHALLARMREENVRAVSIEVSAQALTQHRIDGVVFDVVGFTNLSHDHLDDYGTLERYFEQKLELFQPERARRGVVMVDSDWGRRMASDSRIPVTTLSSSAGSAADWSLSVTSETLERTEFVLEGPGGRAISTSVPLIGWYMAANAALAIVMLVESGYDIEAIAHVLARDGGIDVYVPGRVERISGDRGPAVFIDYGHTPDAFLNTLGAIRKVTDGRIIMVFGADGDRDTTKRSDMGAIAARGADAVVITDFDPRFEDPGLIRQALLDGARRAEPDQELYEVPDPAAAFRFALSLAGEGDVVFYPGPGDEDHLEVEGRRIPFSARDDAADALREAGWR